MSWSKNHVMGKDIASGIIRMLKSALDAERWAAYLVQCSE